MIPSVLLSDTHISVLVDAILQHVPGRSVISYIVEYNPPFITTKEEEQRRAQSTLVADLGERLRRVNGEGAIRKKSSDVKEYNFRSFVYSTHKNYTTAELIKATNCFIYNCHEAEDWEESPTSKIIKVLLYALTKNHEEHEPDEFARIAAIDRADTWCIKDETLDIGNVAVSDAD